MAKIKVGALKPGDDFRTLLTDRYGIVLGDHGVDPKEKPGVQVRFAEEDKWLHPDVFVNQMDIVHGG